MFNKKKKNFFEVLKKSSSIQTSSNTHYLLEIVFHGVNSND